MKKIIKLLILTIIIGHPSLSTVHAQYNTITEHERSLWNQTMEHYLQDTLWNQFNWYDAGHFVMVPMHAAYRHREEGWIEDIRGLMKRWSVADLDAFKETIEPVNKNMYTLDWVHYAYLLSRFIVLEPDASEVTEMIAQYLDEEIHRLWVEYPAWMWDRADFDGGMRERISWKLDNTRNIVYRAIFDVELFVLAIAADLLQYEKRHGRTLKHSETHKEVAEYAYVVHKSEVVYTNGNAWLFQPGIWTVHPDYAYAGHHEKGENLEEKHVPGIGQDSSHAFRTPLWLVSMRDMYSREEERWAYYDQLLEGLAKQLLDTVIIAPSKEFRGVRLTNYMCGHNGLYRYNHTTVSKVGDAAGAYQESACFLLGWWSFTENNEIKNLHGQMAECFPISGDELILYTGMNTTRKRNKFIELPDGFHRGLYC